MADIIKLFNIFYPIFLDATNKPKNMNIHFFKYMIRYSFVLSMLIGIIFTLSIIKLYPNSGAPDDSGLPLKIVLGILGFFAFLFLTRMIFIFYRYKKNIY